MSNKEFFDEQREQSKVKSRIVAEYFPTWAKVIIPWAKKRNSKIAYADLFCGPGRYKDGKASTPLLVLERAIAAPDMREMLVTIFNDKETEYTDALLEQINSLPGIDQLKNQPIVLNMEFGQKIVTELDQNKILLYPTFYFIDPFGYKGLSLSLIASFIKGWGSECLIFFNYNRINMDFKKPAAFAEYINSLFGTERANAIRNQITHMSADDREATIMDAICAALKEAGGTYLLKFLFKKKNRTSHYLIFITKHPKGISIMKNIMANESSVSYQGVPSYEYSSEPIQLSLFASQPLDDLENKLLEDFAGQTLNKKQIYAQHDIANNQYREKDYNEILRRMEASGKIKVTYPGKTRPKNKFGNTFGDDVLITFPAK
ncbi:three-Cys-motif partner protein TcmP [[Phormidium] sp. ETS-05]|uniref:three-Cys-motif partner protein TcmP n=1 Tax=[Phormidium] sp. ETS-05 TaxID=222819 RepID=UPI0018EEF1AF|nr:three-Cys-motif partner protein TcmP [[Phormidium] sp. ETS-05]